MGVTHPIESSSRTRIDAAGRAAFKPAEVRWMRRCLELAAVFAADVINAAFSAAILFSAFGGAEACLVLALVPNFLATADAKIINASKPLATVNEEEFPACFAIHDLFDRIALAAMFRLKTHTRSPATASRQNRRVSLLWSALHNS